MGTTGPSLRARALRSRSGSDESRLIASLRVSEILLCGWTVGPTVALGLGLGFHSTCMGGSLRRLACAFVWLELGGGYLRAAFVEESLLALFTALDVEFPILNTFPIACIANRRNADEVMKFGDRGELLPHVIFSLVTTRDIHVLRRFRIVTHHHSLSSTVPPSLQELQFR